MLAGFIGRETAYGGALACGGRVVHRYDCSTSHESYALRYAYDSLRSGYYSKLAIAFETEVGMVSNWNAPLRIRNPVRSDGIAQYMAYTKKYQKIAGVLVKEAPVLLRSHLTGLIDHIRVCS